MVNCVVIGYGWAGKHHAETIIRSDMAQLLAVVDTNIEKCDEVRERYKVSTFTSLDELLNSGICFEVAIVCTPPALHKEQCIKLIDAGKHILCEKPVCRNSVDIKELQERAKQANIKFGVVFNQRYGYAVQKAKQLISREGGTLHFVTASMYQHWPTELSTNIAEDFMITDACCHLLDTVTYLCGNVESVSAIANKIESQLYSDIAVALRFENGCIGMIGHTNVGGKLDTQHPFQSIDVHTEKFRCKIENQFDRLIIYPHDRLEHYVYEPSVFKRRDYIISMTKVCQEFIYGIIEGGDIPIGIEDALSNMIIIDKIKKSMKEPKTAICIEQ